MQPEGNGLELGFSKRFDTPEFQAALKKSNNFNTRITVIITLVLLPVTALIAAVINPESAAIAIGASVLAFLIVIPIVVFQLVRRNTAKPWDGEVVDLYLREFEEHSDEFIIVCRTDEGKKKKVKDYPNRPLYSYLRIGDRVRFHPQLNVPLEKYDKTHDDYLVCPFCGRHQPLENDYCDKCKKPLLN